MALLAGAAIFASIVIFSFALVRKDRDEKVDIKQRLGQIATEEGITDIRQAELKTPFADRAIKPIFGTLAQVVTRILPSSLLRNLEPRLRKAGYPGNLTSAELLSIKFILALALPLSAYLLLQLNLLLSGLLALVGWILPDQRLNAHIRRRNEEIEKTLPDVIDLLTVSVEAGLGFDGALAKVSEKSEGILSAEFTRVLRESKMGKSRRDALKDMAERLDEESVTTLIGSIVQAEQLGISFARVLRVQSEQVRYKRKQRIEEAAMKAPVKMLIPLVCFIFPTIFVVLLGPAAIQIFTTLVR